MATKLTARAFSEKLLALRSDEELKKHERYFKFVSSDQTSDDYFIGVRMGSIFELGKEFSEMPVGEIEKLLESPIHEMRVGAMSIMGQSAKGKKCTEDRLKELYELYLRRHDRINNWDLVDLAAYYVVGNYLADKPRDILYDLAGSANLWERRTAIVATAHFILKLKQTEDTFAIAEILVNDPEDLVHKGTGWMLRAAGEVNRSGLLAFLDKFAATMPRVLLRYSIEKLDQDRRNHYLKRALS
ncbi:MAG TPA: DNA alkylation repair protein [Pyrinomonadaceae bacterium]|nr:DNA alkylation repair protein [Acidobacteriota bacterium]HQZ97613.1 DNA alkylation repair protein [Pyrinomonadaceae bacterium]